MTSSVTSSIASDQQRLWWQRSIARRTEAYLAESISKVAARSRFLNTHSNKNRTALFDRHEVVKGHRLGKGAFNEVYQVRGFRLTSQDDISFEQQEARILVQGTAIDDSGRCRYVVKHLRKHMVSNRKKFHHAAADLMIEARFLSKLNHTNIVAIRGWSRLGISSYSEGNHDGFFLILDRVDETLGTRIERQRQEKSKPNDHTEALTFALQIASALDYLHDNGIIYRDLKPENIGIQRDNTVKLFDFGLCRELPAGFSSPDSNELFLMTAVGTRRYMAPEVFLRLGYNLKADVYSWAIVFYEMLSLQTPFDMYNCELHQMLVCEEGHRPKLNPEWPSEIQQLLMDAWTQESSRRLPIKTVYRELQYLIGGFDTGNSQTLAGIELHYDVAEEAVELHYGMVEQTIHSEQRRFDMVEEAVQLERRLPERPRFDMADEYSLPSCNSFTTEFTSSTAPSTSDSSKDDSLFYL